MEKGYPSYSKYEHLKEISRKLSYSESIVRGLCRDGILKCTKIEGSWYVDPDSIPKAVQYLQRKRSNKQISLSKLRKSEIATLAKQPRRRKKLIGIEIKLHYE